MSENIPYLERLYARFLTCFLESFFHCSKVWSLQLSPTEVSCRNRLSRLECVSLQKMWLGKNEHIEEKLEGVDFLLSTVVNGIKWGKQELE